MVVVVVDGICVVIAGFAPQVFRIMVPNAEVNWSCKDGDHVQKGEKFGSVRADAGDLLKAERIALNFMQRMSGIATATSDMQRECEVWPMCAKLLSY